MINQALIPMDDLSPKYQLLLISPSQLPLAWKHAVPLLLEGKKHWEDYATLESIHDEVMSGKLHLWMMNDSGAFILAMLTEFAVYPTKRVLRVLWICGEALGDGIGLFLDFVERWAARQGITSIQVIGRKGWVRKLKRYGYVQTQWVVNKNLSGIKEH